jgi:hypothetical protein
MPVSHEQFVLPSWRKMIVVLMSCALLIGVLSSGAEAASYNGDIPFPPTCGTCRMNAGERLTSSGWTLNMQGDGNLVMRNPSAVACFASNTNGHTGSHVSYQTDGNFVVYSSAGTALWSSKTAGKWIGSQYDVSILSGYFYVGNTFIHGPC